eukprot:4552188-Pyramimonas_sp.AAC.1
MDGASCGVQPIVCSGSAVVYEVHYTLSYICAPTDGLKIWCATSGEAVHVMQHVVSSICCAIDVVQHMWCNISGTIHAVQSMWRNISGDI